MASPLGEPCAHDDDFNSWYDDAGACFRVVLHNSTPRTIRLSVQPECSGDVTPLRRTQGQTCSQLLHAQRSARELAQQQELEDTEEPQHDDQYVQDQHQHRVDAERDRAVDNSSLSDEVTDFMITHEDKPVLQADLETADISDDTSEVLYYGADRDECGFIRDTVASFMRRPEYEDPDTGWDGVSPEENTCNQEPSRDAETLWKTQTFLNTCTTRPMCTKQGCIARPMGGCFTDTYPVDCEETAPAWPRSARFSSRTRDGGTS